MGLDMPDVLKEAGVVLLSQTAKRVAIEYRSTTAGIGDPSEKILQGGRTGESRTTSIITEGEYAPGSGKVAKERPMKSVSTPNLKACLPRKKET